MKLPLAYYSDPSLRHKAARINQIDDNLKELVNNMLDTMRSVDGIGLAAPQVHQSLALFITNVPIQNAKGKWSDPIERIFLNPEILSYSEETQIFTEGCLSLPNFYVNVKRPSTIKIRATDMNGNTFEETLTGFPATNFMHEYDHLQGILTIDHMSLEERSHLIKLLKESLNEPKK